MWWNNSVYNELAQLARDQKPHADKLIELIQKTHPHLVPQVGERLPEAYRKIALVIEDLQKQLKDSI